MAKNPPPRSVDTPPTDFASAPPRDLHPTSDIRFVIVEVAKLTKLTERLLSDVKDQGDKIDKLREQATYIKGAIATATVAIGVAIWVAANITDGKWKAVMAAVAALPN